MDEILQLVDELAEAGFDVTNVLAQGGVDTNDEHFAILKAREALLEAIDEYTFEEVEED